MRAILRTTPVLVATALLVVVPTISPGGPPPEVINKGPFNIDPTSAEPDTDFTLSFSNGSRCFQVPEGEPGPVGDRVHIDVVGPRPANTVQASTDVTPVGYMQDDPAGSWSGTLDLNLPEGDYLVTAECIHDLLIGSASSDSEPTFVLLGNGPPPCTDPPPVQTPGDLGPGCYEPQNLVIEAARADIIVDDPTFTG